MGQLPPATTIHSSSLYIIVQLHCLRRILSLLFILIERHSPSFLFRQTTWPTTK